MQVLRPIGMGTLGVIMVIGILALITELMEMEDVAKTVVIPSLIFLIAVAAYSIFQNYRLSSHN